MVIIVLYKFAFALFVRQYFIVIEILTFLE
jgi:hypothetical protein